MAKEVAAFHIESQGIKCLKYLTVGHDGRLGSRCEPELVCR
jgi:hypothetical protein